MLSLLPISIRFLAPPKMSDPRQVGIEARKGEADEKAVKWPAELPAAPSCRFQWVAVPTTGRLAVMTLDRQ